VHVWNGGRPMDSILSQASIDFSIQWEIHSNNSGNFFLINKKSRKLLCCEGDSVRVAEINSFDMTKYQWKFIECQSQPGCYYIVNCGENKFLDTHGDNVTCWNHNGRDIQSIIAGNTTQWAKNIRWWFINCESSSKPMVTLPVTLPLILPVTLPVPMEEVPQPNKNKLTILHLSDTHCMHHMIEKQFPMPPADILLHTGDFSNNGTEDEIKYFNIWLGQLKQRYPTIILILGNHDRWSGFTFDKMRTLLSNVIVLDNEEILVNGLRIYGVSWSLHQPDGRPDDFAPAKEIFSKIPKNVDILMTHCPPYQIFDQIDENHSWGSSKSLLQIIELRRPKVHLFGHLHEQRGVWIKNAASFEYAGGVEFQPWPLPNKPPPSSYPCQIISCNAMKNHHSWDGKKSCIAGPARVIYATMENEVWTFSI